MARVVGLDVPQIVGEALRLADEEGFERLSMRRLSRSLDVTPMAIYHYVANKDELVGLVVDESFADIPVADPALDTMAAVSEVFVSLHRVLVAHPSLAQAMAGRPLEGPKATRVAESVLHRLAGSGLTDEDVAAALVGLFSLTLGSVLYQISRANNEDLQRFSHLTAVDSPTAHRLRWHLTAASTAERQYVDALERLISSYLE